MTITVSLFDLNGRIRVLAIQDAPQNKNAGGYVDLPDHETLTFLEHVGLSHEGAMALLDEVLQEPARVRRHSFNLSAAQFDRLEKFVPELTAHL